ncbi:MAG TPA: sugar transferase [Acidimicrobiia bacterium]|nr:sugar transferase [Acidimicrobiia bacterium]
MRRLARLAVNVGTGVCVLGLGEAHAVAHGYAMTGTSRFAWSLGFVLALLVAAYGFGLPDVPRSRRRAVTAAVGAIAAATASISVPELFVGDALLPRAVVFGSALVLVPWYVLCARLAGDARSRAEERDRVVLIGDAEEGETLRAELDRAPERHAVVVATVAPDDAALVDPPRLPLVEVARATHATVMVLSRRAQSDDDVVLQVARLHEAGVRVRTLSLFYEQWLGKLPVGELERVSLLFDVGEVHAPRYARVKRLFDLALAGAGTVVLALVTPVVVLANLVANRGPLLYRQPRVGRDGRPFSILKFRTMRTVAPVGEPTAERDPRVTRFGRLLRGTHLDELPQMVNILRGELSIVGPRPEQPHLVTELSEKLPFYRLRHLVRPGLTGWAQVKYRYAGTEIEALEKLQYEFFYLRRQSLALDVRIVGRTLRSVMGRDGR